MQKLTHEELLRRQAKPFGKYPFCALLNNIRSLYNVGAIFRSADGVGVEKLWLCGITGIPPSSKISKTALGAEKTVPWEYRENAVSLSRELKEMGYQIVLLEQAQGSVSYEEAEIKPPLCLIVGSEISGVNEELLALADQILEIPMVGLKISLNVAVAFGIAAYQIKSTLQERFTGGVLAPLDFDRLECEETS
ncbi:MAG: RNA methyltransferase [Candidatus Omnitrophica bacterium]|nr:RNA methyltransferase [Candidatus Omnitrophota bacterium]